MKRLLIVDASRTDEGKAGEPTKNSDERSFMPVLGQNLSENIFIEDRLDAMEV